MKCQAPGAVGTDGTPQLPRRMLSYYLRQGVVPGIVNRLPTYTIFCMLRPMSTPIPVEFRGSALDDLRAFPLSARREAGHQLDLVQRGGEPDDWKPMPAIGRGVREIRIREADGAFRIIYVARFADAVYVLHCFQKKTQKTSKADLDLAEKRYRELEKEWGK